MMGRIFVGKRRNIFVISLTRRDTRLVLTTQFDTNLFMSLAKVQWIKLIKSWLKLIFKSAPKIEKDSWDLRTIVYCIYETSRWH